MRPLIPFAEVTMFGALDPDGEVYKKCRITLLGAPTDAVLYSADVGTGQWRIVDQISQGTLTEHPDGSFTLEGASQELVNIVGVPPEEATVRWEIRPIGCSNC